MSSTTTPSARLRELFNSASTELFPFGALPIHAQMAQRAGFPAFFVSGAMVSWWLSGEPDVGLMTRTEIVDNARRIVASVDIPVFCDADTGYGGVQNIRKTVHDFIRAGVAGIHIEDQREPKKAGGADGIALVSDEEAVGRLRAAVDARNEFGSDLVIVARTDGYTASNGSLDEAIRRARLYREQTEVDVIMFEGMHSWDQVRTALSSVPGPAYAIVNKAAGATPSVSELSSMGQAINIVPFVLPGVLAVWELLLAVRDSGEVKPCDDYLSTILAHTGTEHYVGFGGEFTRPTYADVRRWEESYLPAERRRDYQHN